MSRGPDRIKHTYDLTDVELRAALRAYLNVGEDVAMTIEWDSYGDSCEAKVTITKVELR